LRIAILSDIHGNLLALDAVMTDVSRYAPDQIWCGGDIGWGGPWASECIARVREEGWVTVKGNTDVWLTGDPQTVSSPEDRAELEAMAAGHDISQDDARWLTSLPLGHTGAGSILMVHGTPQTPFVAPDPDSPSSEFEPYLDQAKTVVFGHVHQAFMRRLADGSLVVNAGSVGAPMDGPSACYLLLDLEGPDVTVRHRRVDFDRRAVIAEAKRAPGPIGAWTLEKLGAS
jgi:predicted phosphodiesterase